MSEQKELCHLCGEPRQALPGWSNFRHGPYACRRALQIKRAALEARIAYLEKQLRMLASQALTAIEGTEQHGPTP